MSTELPSVSLEEALAEIDIPVAIRESLALVTVTYTSFDNEERTGQLVVHRELAKEVQEIFSILTAHRFPIQKVVPIVAYHWVDEASMQDNNTSAFNYRRVIGTDMLSNHSYGRAIDINPLLNPSFARDGKVYPAGAVYDPAVPGTITKDSDVVRIFKDHGWEWLGERAEIPDYQHFQKL